MSRVGVLVLSNEIEIMVEERGRILVKERGILVEERGRILVKEQGDSG